MAIRSTPATYGNRVTCLQLLLFLARHERHELVRRVASVFLHQTNPPYMPGRDVHFHPGNRVDPFANRIQTMFLLTTWSLALLLAEHPAVDTSTRSAARTDLRPGYDLDGEVPEMLKPPVFPRV